MIRFNRSLNCACVIENAPCPNGERYRSTCSIKRTRSDYARAVTNGADLESARLRLAHVRAMLRSEKKRLLGRIWQEASPFFSLFGLVNRVPIEKRENRTDSLFDQSERREQLTAKEGTKNDLKRLEQMREMDAMLRDVEMFQKHRESLKVMARGIEMILFGMPSKALASSNRFLAIDYQMRAMLNAPA